MIAVAGRVQREGEVVHVIARTLTDLSPLLRSVGERDEASPPYSRADRVKQADSPNLQSRSQIKLQTGAISAEHCRSQQILRKKPPWANSKFPTFPELEIDAKPGRS